ncbi:MAG: FtsL-like putative cell division protein [Bacteroidota bacterium]|nr:FtsL-like putative cell division protein [Bacteroidota bacterium]
MDFNTPPRIERKKYSTVSSMVLYKNLPFLFALCILGLIYIANVHYAEKNIRQSQKLSEEIKELKWDYWTLKSGIMFQSTEGQVSKKVSDKEIYVRKTPPVRLVKAENKK